jgi:hypothetical protein
MRNVGLAAITIATLALVSGTLISGQALAQTAGHHEAARAADNRRAHHTVCKLEAKKVKVHGKWTIRKEKVCR